MSKAYDPHGRERIGTCSDCHFYAPDDQACHRFPPRVENEHNYLVRFGRVKTTDWCGEWQTR